MRIAIRHEIAWRYEQPVRSLLRVLHVTPWAIDSQHLDAWRIDIDCDCRLRRGDDAFGNIVDTVSADEPLTALSIIAQGEVVTTDTAGVLRNALERFPPAFYLRDTAATAGSEALRAFATKAVSAATSPLDRLHALLAALTDAMKPEPRDGPAPTAAEAFAAETGTPRDLAHVFIACARHIGAPARYVSGCLAPRDGAGAETDCSHAWAEAYVPEFGWIGFDPTIGLCAHEGHVRVAIALDHLGAMQIRGAQLGLGEETVTNRLQAWESRGPQFRQERSFGMEQSQFQS